jgi:hypothetical protein
MTIFEVRNRTMFKHEQTPRVVSRHQRKVAKQAALDQAYAVVDARDGKVCQVRGTPLVAGHANEWKALERNHLGPRSTQPERRHDPDNILTVSRGTHRLMQAGCLLAIDAKGEETDRVSQIAGYRWTIARPPFRLRKGNVK